MTVKECVARIKREAESAGVTVHELAAAINNASKEDIARAMEKFPTDALEWAVKFEALSHRVPAEGTDNDCAIFPAQTLPAEAQEEETPQG